MRAGSRVLFALEGAFILGIGLAARLAGLDLVWVVVALAAAWLLTAVVEGLLSRRNRPLTFVPPVRPTVQGPALEAPAAPAPDLDWPTSAPEDIAPEWLESAEILGVRVAGFEPARALEAPTTVDPPPAGPRPQPLGRRLPRRLAAPARPRAVESAPGEVEPNGERGWNVRQLEQLARERGGEDAARDEEWSFLLVYLREFADPDGVLPADFDPLVRESFPELVTASETA